MNLSVIILAAGKGVRMCSRKPKVLHRLAGKPLLEHVVLQVQALQPKDIFCVVGHEQSQVIEQLGHYSIKWIQQEKQLGTAHAVLHVLPHLDKNQDVLVLCADTPLITSDTLKKIVTSLDKNPLSLLVASVDDPTGLGRIIRDSSGRLIRIVEEKDATEEEKKIKEINTGVLAAKAGILNQWCPKVKAENNQQEYYLPDVVNLVVAAGNDVETGTPYSSDEILGVNTRLQLATLERIYQKKKAEELSLKGISFTDPARFDLRGTLETEEDVLIEANVLIEGAVFIGSNSTIGPNVIIRDSRIGRNVIIKANCVLEEADIADGCVVGPFARLRPQTVLKEKSHIGNFVEVKKSVIGKASKVNHLTYIGDATVGAHVNVGAGTITCNYDGVNKHQTIIEEGAFIGSNTSLVAPVRIGMNATIGAGSTITKEAPAETLTVARARQATVPGWERPKTEEQ